LAIVRFPQRLMTVAKCVCGLTIALSGAVKRTALNRARLELELGRGFDMRLDAFGPKRF